MIYKLTVRRVEYAICFSRRLNAAFCIPTVSGATGSEGYILLPTYVINLTLPTPIGNFSTKHLPKLNFFQIFNSPPL
jgi:hypothetical protein